MGREKIETVLNLFQFITLIIKGVEEIPQMKDFSVFRIF